MLPTRKTVQVTRQPARQSTQGNQPAVRQQRQPARQTTSLQNQRVVTESQAWPPADLSHRQSIITEARKSESVKRWTPVLLKCPEIPKRRMRDFAILLENQHKAWSPQQRSILTEDMTTTANIADFTRFALPVMRKSYSRLIADNLVGVQAMNQPAVMLFYLRYRYAMTKGQTVAGTQIMRQNTAQQFARYNGWAIDPYYTSQTVRNETATVSGGTVVSATLAHRPVLAGTVTVEVFASTADMAPSCDDPTPCLRVTFGHDGDPDTVLLGTCASFTSEIAVDTSTPSATIFNNSTGAVQVTLSDGAFPAGAVAVVHYEYDLEGNPFQPEVTMSIDSDSMTAVTRKLKTSWSLEAAQDMKAVHDMDPEALMTDLMADEVVAETDRELINDLIIAAAIRASHNFGTAAGASVNFTDRNIALLYKMLEVGNIIHRTTLRGPANWAVTSSDISSKIEQLNDFRASDVLTPDDYDVGIINAGSIQNKIKMYKDPLFPNCKILMGFKGKTNLDTGLIYGPYIPLLSTPTIYDPNSFSPNKGVMTRYGKKLTEDGGLFYATISVSNL